MDSEVDLVDAVTAPVPPPTKKHPSESTTAEFLAIHREMLNGTTPNYVEGTFRREDIYGDESESDALDEPVGYVTAPVFKTVAATFVCVGKLAPMPIPELGVHGVEARGGRAAGGEA